MNRYWDATEQERAQYTRDEVQAMMTVELMEKGVAKVSPVELLDTSDIELDGKTFYGIEYDGSYSKTSLDIVFATLEDAHAFTELAVHKSDYDYNVGDKYKYGLRLTGLAVTTVELCEHGDVVNMTARLKQQKADKDENEKRLSAFNAAAKLVEDATREVWDDWHDCVSNDSRMKGIVATLAEYVQICSGDATAATAFLLKLHSEEDIGKAAEWCDVRIPLPMVTDDTMSDAMEAAG